MLKDTTILFALEKMEVIPTLPFCSMVFHDITEGNTEVYGAGRGYEVVWLASCQVIEYPSQ